MNQTVKENKSLYFLWIASVLLLFPLLLPLALYTRKTALRLPEAKGPQSGFINKGSQKTISLAMIGESTVAGVGVVHQQQGMVVSTAFHLAEILNCNVRWQAIGENGIDIRGTIERLVPKIDTSSLDYLVVCLGVNDTTGMSTIAKWQKAITELIHSIQQKCSCRLFFSGLPPMEEFTVLPQPLCFVLGVRARLMDHALHHHPLSGRQFESILPEFKPDLSYLSIDGYHPSEKGYFVWGKKIAHALAGHFKQTGTPILNEENKC